MLFTNYLILRKMSYFWAHRITLSLSCRSHFKTPNRQRSVGVFLIRCTTVVPPTILPGNNIILCCQHGNSDGSLRIKRRAPPLFHYRKPSQAAPPIVSCREIPKPEGRHSGESHLLRAPGVTPLGNLALPSDALVFGAHLCPIFESENCHRTFLLRV